MISAKLPSKLPDKFEVEIEYSDTEKKITDSVSLMYDGPNHVVSFALDFGSDADLPYVQNSVDTKLSKARVVQDFNSGLFFVQGVLIFQKEFVFFKR